MFKFKKFFIILVLVVFLIFSINVNVYASVPVTEDNLNKAIQSFISSGDNKDFNEISMSNGKMIIKEGEKTYTIDYDLTGNPKFTITEPIKQGMSYKEYNENTGNLYLLMIGYGGVANVQGAGFENAELYCAFSIMDKALSSLSNGSSKYIIASNDTTITSEDSTVIYESDFGNHVMEYVNSIYSKKQIFSDNTENLLNTFTISIEQTEVTETSCNLVSTLTVNLDADFSKIDEFINALDPFKDITEKNADYVVKLKEGQKCKIESNEKSGGYSISNAECVQIDSEKDTIVALKEGIAKGYLYFDENETIVSGGSIEKDETDNDKLHITGQFNMESHQTKKSIYIFVEENKDNVPLETITLNIDIDSETSSNTKKINDNKTNEKNEESNNVNNSSKNQIDNNNSNNSETRYESKIANISVMPKTGKVQNLLLNMAYVSIGIAIIGIFSLIITIKRK